MVEFKEVTQYSNWGYWDQLNGKTLEKGEEIVVRWPDGGLDCACVVDTIEWGESYSDMGSPTTIPHAVALAVIPIRGATVRVVLRGSGLKAVRPSGV